LTRHTVSAKDVIMVCEDATASFGDDSTLTLLLYRDPEIEDRYLALYIRRPTYDTDFTNRLDEFNEKWEQRLGERSDCVLVTTDFRRTPPENAL
jgi:hypothetical protein